MQNKKINKLKKCKQTERKQKKEEIKTGGAISEIGGAGIRKAELGLGIGSWPVQEGVPVRFGSWVGSRRTEPAWVVYKGYNPNFLHFSLMFLSLPLTSLSLFSHGRRRFPAVLRSSSPARQPPPPNSGAAADHLMWRRRRQNLYFLFFSLFLFGFLSSTRF